MKLKVDPPALKLNPMTLSDETFLYARYVVIEAEKQLRGMGRGPERLDAVTDVLLEHLEFEIPARFIAKLYAKTVYTSVAIQIPPKLRLSKTPAPAPPREKKP